MTLTDRLLTSHLWRPLIWSTISTAIAGVLLLLPVEWIQAVNSLNIMMGENPADMAVYWESTLVGYLVTHIIFYNLRHPLVFNFVDLTIWLLSFLVPPLIIHRFPGGADSFGVCYLAPLAFCLISHLALRNHFKSMRPAVSDNADK